MEPIRLTATHRVVEKKVAKQLRRDGMVPGVLYGHGVENMPLQMEALELKRTLSRAGASQLIDLQIEDAPSARPVLAREIQRDALSGEPIHVDFYAVSMTEKITAEVAILLVGEPADVSTALGLLLRGANTLEIECLPGALIPSLEVDISDLDIGSALYVADLTVPDGITILSDPQEVVAQVIRESIAEEDEEEEEPLLEPASTEVELISRGKPRDEE